MSYRKIRRDYQSHDRVEAVLVDHYAKLVSPVFTSVLVKTKLTPNSVTVLMMFSGFLGAALFAMPLVGLKVLGLLFIHIWYVLDCSDGEVARIKNYFSKFGTEIDYTAHMVNHPLFNLAFIYSLIGMGRWNSRIVLFVAILSISAELVLRNLCTFHYIYDSKMSISIATKQSKKGSLRNMASRIVGFFYIYPNFVLLFPITFLADYYLGTSISLYYFFVQTVVSSLAAMRTSYMWVRTIVSL